MPSLEGLAAADLQAPTGAEILDAAERFIARFCAFPDEHALVAVTLWAAHAHVVEHFHTTPRLAFLSPEPASGKTRALEVVELLVPNPMLSISASPAAIFRTLANERITLLFDEVDAIWSKRGKDDNHEELRALLNAGYKSGATVPRCVGAHHDIKRFDVFAAVALAGLGDLPDTIMSRAVIIRMRRRAPSERVEQFRTRQHEPAGLEIRSQLEVWAAEIGPAAGEAWPELPPGIEDRPAEVWEPLLAVADAAGGDWPTRAREACVALCKVAEDRRVSLGIRLLGDLRRVFGDAEAMHTQDILEALTGGDGLEADAPWGDLYGKPLDPRGLASRLRPYDVTSTKVRIGGVVLQGYRRDDLHDAWTRYLPVVSAGTEQAEQSEQSGSERPTGALSVPDVPDVPDSRNTRGDALEDDDLVPWGEDLPL